LLTTVGCIVPGLTDLPCCVFVFCFTSTGFVASRNAHSRMPFFVFAGLVVAAIFQRRLSRLGKLPREPPRANVHPEDRALKNRCCVVMVDVAVSCGGVIYCRCWDLRDFFRGCCSVPWQCTVAEVSTLILWHSCPFLPFCSALQCTVLQRGQHSLILWQLPSLLHARCSAPLRCTVFTGSQPPDPCTAAHVCSALVAARFAVHCVTEESAL
jgi:hypothetical protein